MTPRDFPEQNAELGPPEGMTVEEVSVLPVFRDGQVVISCWQPTEEERAAIAAGEPIWLWVFGRGMPPVALGTDNPFGATGP